MEDFISLGFGETLQEVFERCHEQGLELPWIVCLVSPNGCTTVMRIHSKEMPGDVLAEHLEPEGFQLPMTIVVVDQRNVVVNVRIEVSGEQLLQ
jgi:GTP cyclohydrolase II